MSKLNLFKKFKIRCKQCYDILAPNELSTTVECSCGKIKVYKTDAFVKIYGNVDDYIDLTTFDESDLPPHK
jgi:hypothetical protein